jgi:hypothetical protein
MFHVFPAFHVFAFVVAALPVNGSTVSGGMAVTPKSGDEPVKWTSQTSTTTGPRWEAVLSSVEQGCARVDLTAGTGALETIVASCKPNKAKGRIQIEPVQVGGNRFILARIIHGDGRGSSLVMFGFLCNQIVRVDLGDDVMRSGAQYGSFPGGYPAFDRSLVVSGERIMVLGGVKDQQLVVEGCAINQM